MFQTWSKFRALTLREKALLTAAILSLPIVRVALRYLGFRRVSGFLARIPPSLTPGLTGQPDEMDLARAISTAALVRIAADRGLCSANCLEQSMALWWLLRVQNIESEIVIGVRKHPRFEAHAWVELQSIVLNDREQVKTDFTPFHEPIVRNIPIR